MKRSVVVYLVAAMTVASGLTEGLAAPRGGSSAGKDYLISSEALAGWRCGAYGGTGNREVEIDHFDRDMRTSMGAAYAGYAVVPWLSPYVSVGVSKTKFDEASSEGNEAALGLGANLNLLNHEILDPALFEDRLCINGAVQYEAMGAKLYDDDVQWSDLSAWLTVSIVNDLTGSKIFAPMSIALFGGPMFSYLIGDVEAKDLVGFTAGIEVFLTQRVSFDVRAESIGDTSVWGGIDVRF
jgi:opacity protein-like surface antigen